MAWILFALSQYWNARISVISYASQDLVLQFFPPKNPASVEVVLAHLPHDLFCPVDSEKNTQTFNDEILKHLPSESKVHCVLKKNNIKKFKNQEPNKCTNKTEPGHSKLHASDNRSVIPNAQIKPTVFIEKKLL